MNRALNALLLAILVLSAGSFFWLGEGYDPWLALAALSMSVGVALHNRWTYFAAAVWGLAVYQLAREGLALEFAPRPLMVLGLVTVALSLYLHERLGRAKKAHGK